MRLRLFRGRSWWPRLSFRRRPVSSADRRASSPGPGQRPRQGALVGSHRKTGHAGQASPSLPGRQDQRPPRGQPDGPQAPAAPAWPRRDGTRLPGAGHALPRQWTTATQARSRRATGQEAVAAAAAAPGAARAAIRTAPDGAGQHGRRCRRTIGGADRRRADQCDRHQCDRYQCDRHQCDGHQRDRHRPDVRPSRRRAAVVLSGQVERRGGRSAGLWMPGRRPGPRVGHRRGASSSGRRRHQPPRRIAASHQGEAGQPASTRFMSALAACPT